MTCRHATQTDQEPHCPHATRAEERAGDTYDTDMTTRRCWLHDAVFLATEEDTQELVEILAQAPPGALAGVLHRTGPNRRSNKAGIAQADALDAWLNKARQEYMEQAGRDACEEAPG